jgi:Ca2+-transporting ATPase
MVAQADATGQPAAAGRNWYASSPDEVTAALGVDPAVGLSARRAAELLSANGPNALPEEKPKPGWLRFLNQYRSYMQIILIAAAIVSLLIKEWSTGVLLLALTVLNAVIGLLGTVQINLRQFAWALVPALALLLLWELGKLIARRSTSRVSNSPATT